MDSYCYIKGLKTVDSNGRGRRKTFVNLRDQELRWLLDYNIPPHITLSIFEYEPGIIDFLKKVVDSSGFFIKSGKVHFSSIGVFHPPVLYYAPIVIDKLIVINEKVFSLLKDINAKFNPYYVPNNWVPHVSLGYNMTNKDLLVAFVSKSTVLSFSITNSLLILLKISQSSQAFPSK